MSNDKDEIVLLQLQLELSREETKRKREEEETKRKHEEEETKRYLAQIALQTLKLEGTFVVYYIFHIFLFLFYILIEPVRRQISLNDILKRKIHEPKEEIIKKMFTRFEVRVNNILLTDNTDLAIETYDLCEALPGDTTKEELKGSGYILNGAVAFNDKLTLCYKGMHSFVCKVIYDEREIKSLEHCFNIFGGEEQLQAAYNITYFDFLKTNTGKNLMMMPLYQNTLEMFLMADGDKCVPIQLYKEIKVAIDYLHSKNYAHMDIKPANICMNDGKIILIDLQSIAPFGEKTYSTNAYLPFELIQKNVNFTISSKETDYWMLAMTLAEKCCGLSIGGSKYHTKTDVINILKGYKMEGDKDCLFIELCSCLE